MYNKPIKLLSGLKNGYLIFRDSSHPLAYPSDSSVYYHRHLASLKVGRWLSPEEHVHHVDENKLNNKEENLQVLSAAEHGRVHNTNSLYDSEDRLLEKYNCLFCQKEFNPLRVSAKKFCSTECSHANSIKDKNLNKEILNSLIPVMSWVELGKLFGYSDTGIKKRAKALGCTIPSRRTRA